MDSIEPENTILNLDSLWFFSNILQPENLRKSSSFVQKPITNNQISNHTIPNLETPSSTTPKTSSSLKKIIPSKADNAGILDIDSRQSLRATEEGREMDRLSKMKRRVKKSLLQKQSITCNVEGINDGDAMKKHLKTWAVAVAYTAVYNTNSSMIIACS